MRLFIPTIGTFMILAESWEFVLYEEHRNDKFANQKGLELGFDSWKALRWTTLPDGSRGRLPIRTEKVTLPKGTLLKIDRIYIRGKTDEAREFDSVSFFCNPSARSGLRGRFWAKLADVNRMEVAVQQELPL